MFSESTESRPYNPVDAKRDIKKEHIKSHIGAAHDQSRAVTAPKDPTKYRDYTQERPEVTSNGALAITLGQINAHPIHWIEAFLHGSELPEDRNRVRLVVSTGNAFTGQEQSPTYDFAVITFDQGLALIRDSLRICDIKPDWFGKQLGSMIATPQRNGLPDSNSVFPRITEALGILPETTEATGPTGPQTA